MEFINHKKTAFAILSAILGPFPLNIALIANHPETVPANFFYCIQYYGGFILSFMYLPTRSPCIILK